MLVYEDRRHEKSIPQVRTLENAPLNILMRVNALTSSELLALAAK